MKTIPGVRYLALRDIVDGDEKEIKTARRRAHRERPIATILDNMNPEYTLLRFTARSANIVDAMTNIGLTFNVE